MTARVFIGLRIAIVGKRVQKNSPRPIMGQRLNISAIPPKLAQNAPTRFTCLRHAPDG